LRANKTIGIARLDAFVNATAGITALDIDVLLASQAFC
jgi:hypothetical protein